MDITIRDELKELAEEEYMKFSSSLLPGAKNVLGVRLPKLRKIAKEIVKGDWRTYLETYDNYYFEEIMLQGMVIGYAKSDIEEILKYASDFIPSIDNWSLCDSFCSGLKITKNNRGRVYKFLQPYLFSDMEFYVRFGIVMLLNYFIESEYIERVLSVLDKIKHEGYYVKTAAAWALSICYIKLPEKTLKFLQNNNLDDFTYNKALQKITESFRIDKETKAVIKSMKRK